MLGLVALSTINQQAIATITEWKILAIVEPAQSSYFYLEFLTLQ